MTPEAQNIAIAEWMGWKKVDSVTFLKINFLGIPPNCQNDQYLLPIPDFLHDLNAMHEAVQHLPEEKTAGDNSYCLN